MPRPTKKGKTRAPKAPTGDTGQDNGVDGSSVATAVAEPPQELQPPSTPIEPREQTQVEKRAPMEKADRRRSDDKAESVPGDKDHIATSLNIAKLQSMSMGELNQMARELGVENFGTMRKHE